jgi:biopolymer transport protein ExbD
VRLQTSKKIHYDSGPNMTPLVDIVMVILIFMMLVSQFVSAEHFLTSNLPISQSGAGNVQLPPGFLPDEPLDIRVDSPVPDRFVATAGQIRTSDPAALTNALRQMRVNLNKAGKADDQIQVKIGPGKNVKYGYLVQVYEAALNAGYVKIAFATSH